MVEFPHITLIIAAYNEENCIAQKIQNSLELKYPLEKKSILVITDGSTDSTPTIARTFESIQVLHESARKGKMAAIDRAVEFAKGEILVFSDANTDLNLESLQFIASAFRDSNIGMVAGEKRVHSSGDNQSVANEGLYWKYESWLKKLDSDTSTVVGAAGELFAIRKSLYKPLPSDTILDDFMLSMEVIKAGFRIKYVPEAYAIETSSVDLKEEWKRKVRISAGGIQSTFRSFEIANPFKFGITSYSYLIHRIARWTIAPLATVTLILSAILLGFENVYYIPISLGAVGITAATIYGIQYGEIPLPSIFKTLAYFLLMNFSVLVGWFRYARGKQSVLWEKAKR
jgi:poly-beta-1,6-N-acetyl-D-glucosamine synthase